MNYRDELLSSINKFRVDVLDEARNGYEFIDDYEQEEILRSKLKELYVLEASIKARIEIDELIDELIDES